MGHESKLKHSDAADELQQRNHLRMDGANDAPTADDPRAILDVLGKVADGTTRPPSTLVADVTRLANNDRDQVWDKMPGLARHIGGEELLEIAALVKYPLGITLEHAKAIAPERLRIVLRSLAEEQLAELADSPKAFAIVRKTLTGPLMSELEYFAECYVEYYREYQGTPETMSKKGGHLATWIKQWFDTHVDNVRLSPERLNGNVDKDAATRPAKKA